MKSYKIIFIIGILLLLLPFFGIPSLWKEWTGFVFGLVLVYIALEFRKKDDSSNLDSTNHIA